ncbi:MAG: ThuA domain-containing protein [Myxococcales bacterium]|nr:MAG: ThuA domain-containing protein [Myxococcales bacterium]
MRSLTLCAFTAAIATAAASFACSGTEPSGPTFVSGGATATGTAGSDSTPTAGTGTAPAAGTSSVTPTGGTGSSTGGSGSGTEGGTTATTGGAGPMGGSSTGGAEPTAGTATGGGSGGSGGSSTGAKGHFKMLVYEETKGYPHPSIGAGNDMLKAMGAANDFEVVLSDGEQTAVMNDPQITAADLEPFDMVFFMNPTGDVFGAKDSPERDIFKTWLKNKKSFAGVHSATDTEYAFPWYEDLVGEIYSGHTNENLPSASVNIEESMKNHPTMVGLPSPWTRNEEWYRFTKGRVTGTLPGFQVLLRFGGPTPSQGPAVGQPISWIRCWEGVRSFYTAMGHDKSAFNEANFKKHVLQGVLWAVRRTSATNETCP